MKNILQNGFEDKLQEIERYAVRQLPANVEPRFAFKLPQEVDHHHWSNEPYLRRVCAQKTGRVVVRGADKKTLYDLAQRGELLARFPKPISDGPFVIDGGIFVQEVAKNDSYLEESAGLYDAMSGNLVHTLPFGAADPCKTKTSCLYHKNSNGKIRDLVTCSELTHESEAIRWKPPYCDFTHFSQEQIQLLIENHARSIFDAATGYLVFGIPKYMFSADEALYSSGNKVVSLYDWSNDYWVGDYLAKKEHDYDWIKRAFSFPKSMECTAHFFNNDVFIRDRDCSYTSKCNKGYFRLHDGKLMLKEPLPLRGQPVQVGSEVWDIGSDKEFIYSLTTGRNFMFPFQGGAHALYDIPHKNPLILAADKQTFYEVPLEQVISLERVRDVLQGNDTRRFDIVIEDEDASKLFK